MRSLLLLPFSAAVVLGSQGCRDDTLAPTAPSPDLASVSAVANVPSFRQVAAGSNHTCAVTTDDRAYCWGFNFAGQVGDGTSVDRYLPVPVLAAGRRGAEAT